MSRVRGTRTSRDESVTQSPKGEGYRLLCWQIPDFPSDLTCVSVLRWCVAVMDPGDRDLSFIASLLSHIAKQGVLTEHQDRSARRIAERIHDAWQADQLHFQQGWPAPPPDPLRDLIDAEPAGSA